MNSKLLGLKIKQLRSEHSLKIGRRFLQKDLADALGISRGYIGDIESGRTRPNNELISKIANVFNVPTSILSDNIAFEFCINCEKLKNLRDINKLTQEELSKILNLDSDVISKLEKLEIGASPELAHKIAVFFNVSFDFLYNDKEITKCPICGLTYEPLKYEDYHKHKITHEKYLKINSGFLDIEDKLLSNFHKLNEVGKHKLIEYSNDLIDTPKYTDNEISIDKFRAPLMEDPESLVNRYTTIAAHDDNLTAEEKREADKKILEALNRKRK
ncbi:hypothetical protein C1H57_12640 [Clostridium sp. 2-1]|uniref:helix-turn-helix domain-containing protein n=1 Tax=Clostridium TaxID=1485 RepID=UPI000CDB82E1|nr:helix-turn-helix transcriptional regulator [Clostridium sp. 2-1]MBN7575984.1 transcriptional regulator [Clostridium beijerinckii]MBN7581183.1 transcriptional regulator [Clostridium beijerinckii]MBN7585705.1 transcriptional regulator [Clostridium beijerinckii]MBO0521494.1 transcriptional regulator [Clostridium beijerinckii]POO91027.1 hypothetical protein C1H57_12640 [Clostridium sp. 2-1]